MAGSTEADRIEALERHAAMVSDGLVAVVDHVRALSIVLATVLAACSDQDRADIRAAALGSLSDAPEDERLRALIEQVTLSATDAGDSTVGIVRVIADAPGRMQ